MGSIFANDIAGMEEISLDRKLEIHLRGNHYPPIEAGLERDFDKLIDLPEGITYKGAKSAPAGAICEQHHLEPFLDIEPWEEG
jgi:hypothetical protein